MSGKKTESFTAEIRWTGREGVMRDDERVEAIGSLGPEKMKETIKILLEALPAQIEIVSIQAKLTRAKYESLVAAGFTEAQALELCIRKP